MLNGLPSSLECVEKLLRLCGVVVRQRIGRHRNRATFAEIVGRGDVAVNLSVSLHQAGAVDSCIERLAGPQVGERTLHLVEIGAVDARIGISWVATPWAVALEPN